MQSKQDGLVPIGEALADLGGPIQALCETPPPARRGFTLADQVNQLVGASEADPDLGFMGRTMALCSLPRSNPGNRLLYKRVNGPYRLYMQAGGAALWQWVYPSPRHPMSFQGHGRCKTVSQYRFDWRYLYATLIDSSSPSRICRARLRQGS